MHSHTRTTDEGLLRYVIQFNGLPLNAIGDQWAVAVSRILLDLQRQGVELEVPVTPHVPYLDN
jgi:hypothetical protein